MNPGDFRQQIHQLQRAVAELQQGWCIAVCSADERLIGIVSLLLEGCDWAAGSIAELLALPLPEEKNLLLICDDELADGRALELIERLPEATVLVCLDAAISQERLAKLSALYRKVGVRDQRALLAWGLGQGLVRPRDLACRTPDH